MNKYGLYIVFTVQLFMLATGRPALFEETGLHYALNIFTKLLLASATSFTLYAIINKWGSEDQEEEDKS